MSGVCVCVKMTKITDTIYHANLLSFIYACITTQMGQGSHCDIAPHRCCWALLAVDNIIINIALFLSIAHKDNFRVMKERGERHSFFKFFLCGCHFSLAYKLFSFHLIMGRICYCTLLYCRCKLVPVGWKMFGEKRDLNLVIPILATLLCCCKR